jgi:hypothetical protein
MGDVRTPLHPLAAPPWLLHTRLLLGCANLHAPDRHWMPYRHAAGTGPALCLVPAGLACANLQSGRVHLGPNLQAVEGAVVLSLQAGQEPQKVGISGPPTPEPLPSSSPQAAELPSWPALAADIAHGHSAA